MNEAKNILYSITKSHLSIYNISSNNSRVKRVDRVYTNFRTKSRKKISTYANS